jgi:hypothetical protein
MNDIRPKAAERAKREQRNRERERAAEEAYDSTLIVSDLLEEYRDLAAVVDKLTKRTQGVEQTDFESRARSIDASDVLAREPPWKRDGYESREGWRSAE